MTFRELLKECDINGAQLGRRLSVSRAMVSLWVTGKCVPGEERIGEIARVLMVSKKTVKQCFV